MKIQQAITDGRISMPGILSLPNVFITVRSFKAKHGLHESPAIWVGNPGDICFTKEGPTLSDIPNTRRIVTRFQFPCDKFGRVLDPIYLNPQFFKIIKVKRGRIYQPVPSSF